MKVIKTQQKILTVLLQQKQKNPVDLMTLILALVRVITTKNSDSFSSDDRQSTTSEFSTKSRIWLVKEVVDFLTNNGREW